MTVRATLGLVSALFVGACGGGGGSSADNGGSSVTVNAAPVLSVGSTFSFEEESTEIVTTASATDSDAITWSISGSDAALFAITSAGALSFISAPDYEAPQDSDSDNAYIISVSASDGSLSSSADITINVTNINDAPTLSGTSFSINENSTLIPDFTFSDPDGDTLTVTSYTPDYYHPVDAMTNPRILPGYSGDIVKYDGQTWQTLGNEDGTNLILSENLELESTNYKLVSDVQLADGVTLKCLSCQIYGESDGGYRKIEVRNGTLDLEGAAIRKVSIQLGGGLINGSAGDIFIYRSSIIDASFLTDSDEAGAVGIGNVYFENVNKGREFVFISPSSFRLDGSIFYNSGAISLFFSNASPGSFFADADSTRSHFLTGNTFAYGEGTTDAPYQFISISSLCSVVSPDCGEVFFISKNIFYPNAAIKTIKNSETSCSTVSCVKADANYFGVAAEDAPTTYLDNTDSLDYGSMNVVNTISAIDEFTGHVRSVQNFTPKLVANSDGTFSLDVAPDYEAYDRIFNYLVELSDGSETYTAEVSIKVNNLED